METWSKDQGYPQYEHMTSAIEFGSGKILSKSTRGVTIFAQATLDT